MSNLRLKNYLKNNHIKESFYPRLFEDLIDIAREQMFHMPQTDEESKIIEQDKNKKKKLQTEGSSLMNKYYRNKFGIMPKREFQYVDEDEDQIVAKVMETPIIKNPTSFEGFDDNVRIIINKQGDMYVAKYDAGFNHGMMANALIRTGEINTIWYNEKGTSRKTLAGIYEDQKDFLLLNRLYNTNKIIQSDTFKWEGRDTEFLIKRLKQKHPQFEFYLRYNIY